MQARAGRGHGESRGGQQALRGDQTTTKSRSDSRSKASTRRISLWQKCRNLRERCCSAATTRGRFRDFGVKGAGKKCPASSKSDQAGRLVVGLEPAFVDRALCPRRAGANSNSNAQVNAGLAIAPKLRDLDMRIKIKRAIDHRRWARRSGHASKRDPNPQKTGSEPDETPPKHMPHDEHADFNECNESEQSAANLSVSDSFSHAIPIAPAGDGRASVSAG